MFEISRLDETVIRALLTGSLRVYYCMSYEYSWFWPNLSILAIGIAVGLKIPLIHDVLLFIIPPTMTDVETFLLAMQLIFFLFGIFLIITSMIAHAWSTIFLHSSFVEHLFRGNSLIIFSFNNLGRTF
jgi:hypothetical protein